MRELTVIPARIFVAWITFDATQIRLKMMHKLGLRVKSFLYTCFLFFIVEYLHGNQLVANSISTLNNYFLLTEREGHTGRISPEV